MGRSMVAVAIGYLVFALSAGALFRFSGRDPHVFPELSFLAFSVAYGVLFGALGGYIAGVIARQKEPQHAGIVAAVMALGALASVLGQTGQGSPWSQAAVLLLVVPATVFGGALRQWQRRNHV